MTQSLRPEFRIYVRNNGALEQRVYNTKKEVNTSKKRTKKWCHTTTPYRMYVSVLCKSVLALTASHTFSIILDITPCFNSEMNFS